MALPDYFGRGALAASQVLSGFDEAQLATQLADTRVGVSFGPSALVGEGRMIADLAVRLAARFYPTLVIDGPDALGSELADRARAINPKVEFGSSATIGIAIGVDARVDATTTIYAGCAGWDASVGTTRPYPVGATANPFGAGVAATLACANVFRALFLPATGLDLDVTASALYGSRGAQGGPDLSGAAVGDVVLVGAGAIGNGAVWALGRAPVTARVHVVDPETVDLGHNLPRYVLTHRADVGRSKVEIAIEHLRGTVEGIPYATDVATFLSAHGYGVRRMLLALDSARDRRAAQASLPVWIANGWTQPGDLGVSVHPRFGGDGACVRCLYLPDQALEDEDDVIATALRVKERLMEIRVLLHRGEGVPRDLLEAVAGKFEVGIDRLLPFEGRSVRDLYVEGLCGGAIVPVGGLGAPRQEVHVPLAHQTALAGVLLAAALVRDAMALGPVTTSIARVDVLRPLADYLTTSALKDPRGICICQDADYLAAYDARMTQANS